MLRHGVPLLSIKWNRKFVDTEWNPNYLNVFKGFYTVSDMKYRLFLFSVALDGTSLHLWVVSNSIFTAQCVQKCTRTEGPPPSYIEWPAGFQVAI